MTTRRLSRRTVLRGLGTAVALPLLDAMLPRGFGAEKATKPPRRMAFIYSPNGAVMPHWTPKKEGKDFELPACLLPMKEHRDDLLVFSGLTCDKARANGDGAGDHARASGAFLTGAQAKKTAGANFQAGLSADQLAAQKLGEKTRLPSLELAVEKYRGAGNCDSGYSCVYEHTMSWRDATTPVPPEVNPRLVFDRLFADKPNDPETVARNELRASVLDAVLDDAKDLTRTLGGGDKRKLDQYLSSVREVEKRLTKADPLTPLVLPDDVSRPAGVPADLTEHIRLLCDLLVLAFQTDTTRISTLMLGREGSEQKYHMVGVNEGHHTISHHMNSPTNLDKLKLINTYLVTQLAYLTGKLKGVKEGDGTLLDNCMIAFGSAIADPNRHHHHDLPLLLVGRGGGSIKSGRHIRYKDDTPLNNLWLAMLARFGVKADTLGDSTGVLDGLE
jgi:hypothetical protein